MRHQKAGRKFSRTSAHRTAMFRNMATSLLIHDRIRTTDAKAKELRSYVEKMITLARKAQKTVGTGEDKTQAAKALHLRRQALQYIRLPRIDAANADDRKGRKELLDKLFVQLAERYADRPGGYTRILKIGQRRGDAAPVSLIEFVDGAVGEEKATKKKSKKKTAAPHKEEAKAQAVAKTAEESAEEPTPEAAAESDAAVEEPAAAAETEPEPETEAESEKSEGEAKKDE